MPEMLIRRIITRAYPSGSSLFPLPWLAAIQGRGLAGASSTDGDNLRYSSRPGSMGDILQQRRGFDPSSEIAVSVAEGPKKIPSLVEEWKSTREGYQDLPRPDKAWQRIMNPIKPTGHKSFRLRSEKFMRPFAVDVFFSKKFIHANIMHRVTSRVIATVATNSKHLKAELPSRVDSTACRIVGELLAERAKEADCYTVVYTPRRGEKVVGKLAEVLSSLANNGISIYHTEKGIMLSR